MKRKYADAKKHIRKLEKYTKKLQKDCSEELTKMYRYLKKCTSMKYEITSYK